MKKATTIAKHRCLVSFVLIIINLTGCIEQGDDDPENGRPEISDQEFTITEDVAVGTVVGIISVDDPDNDDVDLRIDAGNDDNTFSISNSNQLVIASDQNLDATNTPRYFLSIEAEDEKGARRNATVIVNVTASTTEPDNELSFQGVNYELQAGLIEDFGAVGLIDVSVNSHYSYDFYVSDRDFVFESSTGTYTTPGANILIYAEMYSPNVSSFQAGTFSYADPEFATVEELEGNAIFPTVIIIADGRSYLAVSGVIEIVDLEEGEYTISYDIDVREVEVIEGSTGTDFNFIGSPFGLEYTYTGSFILDEINGTTTGRLLTPGNVVQPSSLLERLLR